MYIFLHYPVCFLCVVTAHACFKDKVSSVTITNIDGPIYVSPCSQNVDNQCSQLYHISGNPVRECDCACAAKNVPIIPPVLCTQSPCALTTPQVSSAQTPCTLTAPQVRCAQTPCTLTTPQGACAQSTCLPMGTLPCTCNAFTTGASLQGCVSLQGTYLQTWQGSGTPWAYYHGCPDQHRDGWPCYKCNDVSSLPVAKYDNQYCQCGLKRSGYY